MTAGHPTAHEAAPSSPAPSHPSKVWVDPARCQGHARCYVLAPETFYIDDEGYGHVLEGREHSYDEPNVVKAIKNCPERAIILVKSEA